MDINCYKYSYSSIHRAKCCQHITGYMVKSFRAYNSHRTMLWYGYDSYSFALQHISRYISMNTICYMETINIVRICSCLEVHIVYVIWKCIFWRGNRARTIFGWDRYEWYWYTENETAILLMLSQLSSIMKLHSWNFNRPI